MAWTAPRTWVTLEKVTAALMNTHLRDNLLAIGLVEWTTWSPSYSNITIGGGGTEVARYQQNAKTVTFFWSFTFGSGSAVGSNPTVSLPVTAATGMAATGIAPIATVRLNDANGVDFMGQAFLSNTTTAALVYINSAANIAGIGATTPFTWATGDILIMIGTYEAA